MARQSEGAWSAQQRQNAQIIAQVGRQMGMSERDIQIALATAMQESGLRNLTGGDRDSAGLFQQRPSQGWGTLAQVTDPAHAAASFYSHLAKVKNRDSLSLTQAAQAVQRSGYPNAYAAHEQSAASLLASLGPSSGTTRVAPVAAPVVQPVSTTQTIVGGTPAFDLAQQTAVGLPNGTAGAMGDVAAVTAPGVNAAVAPGSAAADKPLGFLPTLSQEQFTQTFGKAPSPTMVSQTSSGGVAGAGSLRARIIAEAERYLGTPYKWGGTAPGGFDCSGLIQYVYSKMGVTMPRVSFQQANSGRRVNVNSLQPGDLVAWDNSTRNNGADHIAIYAGNGQIIEAPRPGMAVRTRKLASDEGAWGVSLSI